LRRRNGIPGPLVRRPLTLKSRSNDREVPFRALFESSIDAILIADDSRRYVDANPAACELLGIQHSDVTRYRIDDFAAPALRAHIEEAWASFLREGKQRGEYELIRLDGTVRSVEFNATANVAPGLHLSSLRDVTRRKKAEQSLHMLSARILQLQDDERRRLARDLHDSVGQDLTALKLGLAAIGREIEKTNPQWAAQVFEYTEMARHVSDQLRTISYLLHPPLLDDLGLGSALRWYVEGFEKRSGIRTHLEMDIDPQRLPPELETMIFRTVQEGLTNIHRHSKSSTALIRLHRHSGNLVLEIHDEGQGIPQEELAQITSGVTTSVGLQGMRERIRQFHGEWEILSDGHGLKIRAIIPASNVIPASNGGST
jgi:PAS domain S-box-containing protein